MINQMASIPDTRLSQMEDGDLVQRQLAVFKEDKDWRDKHVNFHKCRYLYERKSGDRLSDTGGIPVRNLIRRAVNDRHALSITNVPKTKLVANIDIDFATTFVERFVNVLAGQQAESVMNGHVENILRENNIHTVRSAVLKQAAIYGVGYYYSDIDQSGDTRLSARLRQLMRKPLAEWTERDAATYAFLLNRIEVRQIDTPDIYWQHGIRVVDDTMIRVSMVERADVNTLRRLYDNPYIRSGQFPHELDEDPEGDGDIAAVLTTWELEPVVVSKSLETTDGETLMEVDATDWVRVKTVIAGGQLVEKTITANFEDEENGIEEGPIFLPIIPCYLERSETHPYGYSIPEQMEISEEFINRMYLIMYKSARKAASNNGLIINASLLGDGDIFKIEQILSDGGVATIRGNDTQNHNPDLSRVVVPVNPNNVQLPVSVVEAVRNEESAFREASGSVNLAAIARSRSGSGKRAEITATDRPKLAQIENIATCENALHETVYNLVQIYHREHVNIPVDVPGQGRQMVPINMEVDRIVPILDDAGNPVFNDAFADPEVAGPLFNPAGLALQKLTFVVNSVLLDMKAVSDAHSDIPHDKIQRLQMVSGIHSIAPLEPETLHQLLLPKEIQVTNDAYKRQRMEREAEMQARMAALGVEGQGGETPKGINSATFPRLDGVDGLSTLMQDVQNDQSQARRELSRDQQRLGQP